MRSAIARTALLLLGVAAALTAAGLARSHEGHDHGAPPPPVTSTIAPRADASSAEFEIVLIARGTELVIYLDEFRTNAPITGAALEIDSPAGLLKPVARADGSYAATAPFLANPGTHDLAITITSGETVDILTATLKIPEPPAQPPAAVGLRFWFSDPALAEGLLQAGVPSGLSLWGPLAAGFVLGLVCASLLWRRRFKRVAATALAAALLLSHDPVLAESPPAVVARDLAQRFPDGALFVPKPTQRILALRTVFTDDRAHRRAIELPGRIIPSPNASGYVQASVGGRLSPPPAGFKPLGTAVRAGDVLAYVRPPLPLADATAQQQQARELDQQISIVARKVDRLRSIERVIARGQLEDAELELKGLQGRRANLDRVQRDPEALVSPVDGVIAAANAVAGQMAEPNAVIFHIVDPAALWVEALSYEAHTINGSARAVFTDGRSVDLDHVGTGGADRNQAVPIQFAIRGSAAGLRVGQFVTVLAATAEVRRGMALPREAVLRGASGQSIVYEHTNAERFVAREVRVEPLDGTHVLVLAGIERGRRIVTQGAELLNQIR